MHSTGTLVAGMAKKSLTINDNFDIWKYPVQKN
jgi:hypothetical protein